MSAYIYDQALLEKFKYWTNSTQIQIYGPEQTRRMFEVMADKQEDKKIKLPIIAIRRLNGYTILNTNKRVLTYDGLTLEADELKSITLNAIPIKINYQVDIYAKFYKDADAISRDVVFNIINHPTLQVVIPYNGVNFTHNCNIRIAESVQDNSDIPERLFPGEFTRLTVDIDIDDAYLWDARVRSNVSIDVDGVGVEIVSGDTDTIIEPLNIDVKENN